MQDCSDGRHFTKVFHLRKHMTLFKQSFVDVIVEDFTQVRRQRCVVDVDPSHFEKRMLVDPLNDHFRWEIAEGRLDAHGELVLPPGGVGW